MSATQETKNVSLLSLSFFSSNFHPLEAVPRSRDPQLQASGNYPGVSNWPFFFTAMVHI